MKAVKIVFTSLIHVITCAVIQSYVLAALIWYYDIPLQTYLVCAAIVLALLVADLLAGRFLLRDVGLKRGWRAVLHYTDLLLMLPCLYFVFSDLFQHGFAMTLKEAAPVVSMLLADALQISERARLDRKSRVRLGQENTNNVFRKAPRRKTVREPGQKGAFSLKTGNKALAILAGVFLILHALLYVFFYLIPWLSSPSLPEPDLLRRLCIALILPAAGVFLLRRQPKIAAVLMTVLAAAALLCYAEEIACYLSETPPTAAAARYAVGGHFPARFFVIPLMELTAALLLAAQFYTRGFAALLIPLFVAAAEIAAAHGTLERFAYVAGGHPSPLNYLMPFNYVLASVLIGMYLVTANPMLSPGETSDGHSGQ